MLNPKEIRSILLSAHGMHHSQFESLHVQPSKSGYSASFHNAVTGVELTELESKLRANPKLLHHQVLAYRRGSNVIVRIQKPGTNNAIKLNELRGETPRAYFKHEISQLLNISKEHYFNYDAYASRNDWVVVYYACELDLQVFRDKLNASKYFGKYSIKTKNDNVYIRLNAPVVPEQYLKPREIRTRTPKHSLTPNEPVIVNAITHNHISDNSISVKFVKSVLSNIANYELEGSEVARLATMCANAITNNDTNIQELNDIAAYIGKEIQISLA